MGSNSIGKGLRFNNGKTRHELVPPFAQEQYARVLTRGAEKYAPRNWEKGMPWSNVISSLKRHLLAIESGQDFDPESGCLHAAHLMCNAAFLTEYYKIYPMGDDRPSWYSRKYRIGLDIDEVLADFCGAYCSTYELPTPEFWNFDRKIAENFADLKDCPEFWKNLPVKTKPQDIPFEPSCYITSRNIPVEWTIYWLDANGYPAVPVFQVGVDGSKVEIAKAQQLDIFVDDRMDNFLELNEAGVFTYLFDAPHNQRYDVGHKRIFSLADIVNR